jgi:hypothetical protein
MILRMSRKDDSPQNTLRALRNQIYRTGSWEKIQMGMGKALLFVPWTWLAFPFFPNPKFFTASKGEGKGEGKRERNARIPWSVTS